MMTPEQAFEQWMSVRFNELFIDESRRAANELWKGLIANPDEKVDLAGHTIGVDAALKAFASPSVTKEQGFAKTYSSMGLFGKPAVKPAPKPDVNPESDMKKNQGPGSS